jgi:hypothetical protein
MRGTIVETLEDRVKRLEDTLAVGRVMATYGECIDNGYDWAGLESILAPDLRWESNAFGSYANRAEYFEGQRKIKAGISWAFHTYAPVRITIEGDKAKGTFYLLMLATFLSKDGSGRAPIVLSARYDNDFRRSDRGWLCERMKVQFHQVSPITRGWVEEQFFAG